jgi:hypothetical protein
VRTSFNVPSNFFTLRASNEDSKVDAGEIYIKENAQKIMKQG